MTNGPAASPIWPADNPAVIAHMGLLQGVINRLANNSASSKTWCLTLVGALVSLTGATHVPEIVTFSLVPIAIFGFMDTMYLAQEKAYRDLHAHIVTKIRDRSYSLIDAYEAKAPMELRHFGSALRSWSIFPVYGGLILVYLIARCAGWLAVLATASTKSG